MMMFIDSLSPAVALIIMILLIVWWVIFLALPFYVYGSWYRARECSRKLDRTNELLEAINAKSGGGGRL